MELPFVKKQPKRKRKKNVVKIAERIEANDLIATYRFYRKSMRELDDCVDYIG